MFKAYVELFLSRLPFVALGVLAALFLIGAMCGGCIARLTQ